MPTPSYFPFAVKTVYDPNSLSFPRGRFLAPFLRDGTSFVHPPKRDAYLPFFKEKNLEGYHHDLGAQDVFLDNFGMLVAEQLSSLAEFTSYQRAVHHCLRQWSRLRLQVVQRKPWWGS